MKLIEEVNKKTQLDEAFTGSEEEELARAENAARAAGFTPGTPRFKGLVTALMIVREDDPSLFNKAVDWD